jgi:hypothetical protein
VIINRADPGENQIESSGPYNKKPESFAPTGSRKHGEPSSYWTFPD